jgi:hypothetical protein
VPSSLAASPIIIDVGGFVPILTSFLAANIVRRRQCRETAALSPTFLMPICTFQARMCSPLPRVRDPEIEQESDIAASWWLRRKKADA